MRSARMKALTLTQPWATLVAIGVKRIETRSWYTHYRGPLAIHAAKGFPNWARAQCLFEPFVSALRPHCATLGDIPRGVVLATCNLVGCREIIHSVHPSLPEGEYIVDGGPHGRIIPPPMPALEFGDYSDGRWAWILEDVERSEERRVGKE